MFILLTSAYDYEIPPHGHKLIKTDLQIALPENTYGRIAPRSGLALNSHIGIGGKYNFFLFDIELTIKC